MGLLNKIKGIFMEEVIEEVDEDTTKIEKIKEKDKVAVAKKIETPPPVKQEVVEPVLPKKEEVKEEVVVEPVIEEEKVDDATKEFSKPIEIEKVEEPEFKFPMNFDDHDFEVVEDRKYKVEPEVKEEEPLLYHERRTEKEVSYTYEEPQKVEPYEIKEEKKHGFQRSPIISPVYGILDKNYKKEEIVQKREIRLTTNNKKADLDLVREKAYGELANDITESIHENSKDEEIIEDEKEEKTDKDNLFYDLSEDASPSVKVVTVEDAEEYYNDLGLEYNVDYKVVKDETSINNGDKKDANKTTEEDESEDELFNLIDAMYDSK